MPNVTLHFYAANDLNGDVLLELTDENDFFKGCELKVALSELGGGSFRLARKVGFPLFDTGAVAPDVFCRVLVHAYSDTEYFWGFFINKRAEVLVGKEGSEEFQFGGPGPKQYLDRGGLSIEQYTGAGWNIDLDAGVFRWNETATAGRILHRVVSEAFVNPDSGVPDLTTSFTATDDSNSDPWVNDVTTAGADDFELPIGTSILKALWELEDIEDIEAKIYLGTVAAPEFRLDAVPQLGTDYSASGTGYGATTLRFLEGNNADYPHGNIGSLGGGHKVTVEGTSTRFASHVNVKGKDGSWATAVRSSWSAGEYVKWATISYPRSSNVNILEKAGIRWLRAQQQRAEEITIPLIPGDDDIEGRYFPVPDDSRVLWVGNTASFHTGPATGFSPLDYRNEDFRVTRIDLELLPASDDTDALTRALSWQVEVSFNTVRGGSDSPRQQTTGRATPGAPGPKPCVAASGASISPDYVDGVGVASDAASSHYPMDISTSGLFMLLFQGTNSGDPGTTAVEWWQSITGGAVGPDASPEAFTLIDADYSGSDHDISAWGLQDPDLSTDVDSEVGVAHTNSRQAGALLVYSGCQGPTVADAIRDTATATGTSTSPSVSLSGLSAGDKAVAAISYHHGGSGTDDTVVTPPTGWTPRIHADAGPPTSSTHDAGIDVVELIVDGTGSVTATWTLDTSRQWMAQIVVLKGEGSFDAHDGNVDLVGTSDRYARCDHRHDVHRDTAPTVDDDFETAGYKIGTIWAQLDDLDAPTEIVAVYILADDSTGAAVWLELPSGGAVTEITDLPTAETDTDLVLHPDGAGGVEWAADATGGGGGGGALQADRDKDTATASPTENAGTWTDTGLSVTMTTGANRCLITVVCLVDNSSATGRTEVDVTIDGTREGGTAGLLSIHAAAANESMNGSFSFVTAQLSAASHTFKVQFRRVTAGTSTFYMGASGQFPILSVVELAN